MVRGLGFRGRGSVPVFRGGGGGEVSARNYDCGSRVWVLDEGVC